MFLIRKFSFYYNNLKNEHAEYFLPTQLLLLPNKKKK